MQGSIRVIDGGGNGFRRADVYGTKVLNFRATKKREITGPIRLVDFATSHLPKNNRGIAYAMAGDVSGGVVVKSPQIPWLNRYDLGYATFEKCRKRVLLVNDMDGAVAGMAKLLNNPPYFMGITWSSGIGMRVWIRETILSSCEGGHICVDPSPYAPLCGCGLHGCAEAAFGGEAIRREVITRTKKLGVEIPEGLHPCTFLDNHFQLSPWANSIYDMITRGMGGYLATLQTLFRFPLVVWKGTFASCALPLIEKEIRNHIRTRLMNPNWEKEMEFKFSPDPQNDSLIGAAALFQQTYK